MIRYGLYTVISVLLMTSLSAQKAFLEGQVSCDGENSIATIVINGGEQTIYSDEEGRYKVDNLNVGKIEVTIFSFGYNSYADSIFLNPGKNALSVDLLPRSEELDEMVVNGEEQNGFSITRLRSIEGTSVYAGKKNEVIELSEVSGNTSNNNSREIFAKIPGLNIWESDDAGIQLGIGARGLSPKRTESFNVRQNGYDISADALGYPESYYTPAADALESIQIVRGAASLQYGSQFGGLLNFVMKKPSEEKLHFTTKNTYGAYNQFTSYNSVSGSVNRFSYFAYFQYKRGDGWRPNSHYDQTMGFANLNYHFSENMKISLDYTSMQYYAQQPGGLTDNMFEQDPTQSIRERNWFKVNWNLLALRWQWDITPSLSWSARAFGLKAGRQALGYLGRIDRVDPMQERNLISGDFTNSGVETRVLKRYKLGSNKSGAFLIGGRYYMGLTNNKQGYASDGSDPDFRFINQNEQPLLSDFDFPSQNLALFSENVFFLSDKWTVVPGARFEFIDTKSEGSYLYEVRHPLTNEVLVSDVLNDDNSRTRSFFLMGLGTHYKLLEDQLEIYANFSQNYRAINFSDIRINNPNFRVDPDIQDEDGFNTDIGVRGSFKKLLTYDVSLFLLKYNNRIGEIIQQDTTKWTVYRYRTNISDARNYGVEAFVELDWLQLNAKENRDASLKTFVNFSLIDARYINSSNTAVLNNKVEMVAPLTLRAGLNYSFKDFQVAFQVSYVEEHYTDATNAESTTDAIYGVIPAYFVADISTSYKIKDWVSVSGGVNNLTNSSYFTRRAVGYPGPGIIPAMPISGYVSLRFDLKYR